MASEPARHSPALTATVGELDTASATRAANVERPAGLTLSDELIQDIRNMPHGSRPDPKTYTAPEVMAEHLGHFDEGAARFMTDTNLQKYGIDLRDGTAFVIPAAEANALEAAAAGSATKLEKALGLPDGLLQNNNLVRVDIPKPRELDLRMPSGNEAGANSQWIPGGGGEAVISVGRLQPGQYSTRVVTGGVGSTASAGARRTVLSTSGVSEQAQLASSMVPGLPEAQARVLLDGAFNPNKPVDVVLGGSRVRSYFGEGTYRLDSDLDIGFNPKMKNNQVDRILAAFDAQGPLQSERGIRIFPGDNPPSGPIISPREFFQRLGFRGPFPPERAGQPFGPSGFISFHPDGTITIVSPRGGL